MKNIGYILVLLSCALLACCHTASDNTALVPTAHPVAATVPPPALPVVSSPSALEGPAYVGYHRYRGTVGGLPVLLELTVSTGPGDDGKQLKGSGTYFYEQKVGGTIELKFAEAYQPRQPLRLTESSVSGLPGSVHTWQATQPLGPVLTGDWVSATGRHLPFVLRESYQAAVRYEVVSGEAKGHSCADDEPEHRDTASISREYLHLLGGDTLRPALRRLQCPPLARRRRLLRTEARADSNSCKSKSESLIVSLNAYGLLSVGMYGEEYYFGARHPEYIGSSSLYDLYTGRLIRSADIWRPGADTLLERLAAYYLAHSPEAEWCHDLKDRHETWVRLPDNGIRFDSQGIVLEYRREEAASFWCGGVSATIPYTELLPLLRPASPVARMLRERGLWKPAKPR